MHPAAVAFFSTVELVDLLSTFLDHKSLARLSTTSPALYYVSSPIIWRNVAPKDWQWGEKMRAHVERLKGLAGREHYARTLDMDADSLVLYLNGIGEPVDPALPTRPDWLPAPNPRSFFRNVCFSPMTRLTRFECGLDPSNFYPSSSIPGVDEFDSSNLLPQLCWLVELNPSLIRLSLTKLKPTTALDRFLLARSIGSLSKLRHLRIESVGSGEPSFEDTKTLFFCLPKSLESLNLGAGYYSKGNMEMMHSGHIAKTLTLRDGSLLRLKKLELPIHKATPQSEYGRILEHCPNIDTLGFLPLHRDSASIIKEITPLVKRHCRHIRSIKATTRSPWWRDWNPFSILDGVNSTLKSLQFDSYNPRYDDVSEDLAVSSFQYHSATLRDIRLTSCLSLGDKIIQSILKTCAALERLEIIQGLSGHRVFGNVGNEAGVRLPDLVAYEWVCTGLKHLDLTIDWGQFDDPTPVHLPAYYLRHAASYPLDQEQERWGQLERLYGQIGSLVELEVLNLNAYINRRHTNRYEPKEYVRAVCGGRFDRSFRSKDRFPLLLSLGVHGGRCGYLNWLSGLKNLKELRGSVHLGNPEVAMTLKQAEVEWMIDHWPKLQVLELLPYQEETHFHVSVDGYEHLNWLMKQKPGLELRRSWRTDNKSWDGLWTQAELDGLLTIQEKDWD
ncbi:MAG: hypothetical protein JOS17DRAFT_799627 [Linnemannia elongata]|nr:MAG: hypothetical protein JOS17DRAFT_799627 [Linnemannia elongata]